MDKPEFQIIANAHHPSKTSFGEELQPQDCPLCLERFDNIDVNFCPCHCVFKLCRFCWYRVFLSQNPVCPGCRKGYSGDSTFRKLKNSILGTIESIRREPGAEIVGGAFDILNMLAFFDAESDIPVKIFLPSTGVIDVLASKMLVTFSCKSQTNIRMLERIQVQIRRFTETTAVIQLCMKYFERVSFAKILYANHTNFRKSFLHDCLPHMMSVWNHVIRVDAQDLSQLSLNYYKTLCSGLSRIGFYPELLQLTQKSLPLILRVCGPGHVSTLKTKADIVRALWKLKSEDSLLGIYKKVHAEACLYLGRHHRLSLNILNEMVAVTMTTGNFEEALRLSFEALCVSIAVLGSQNTNTLILQRNRGILFGELKNYNEALLILKKTYDTEKLVCGVLNTATLTTEHWIANILYRQGNHAGSVQVYADLLRKFKEQPRRDEQVVVRCASEMAFILNKMEESEEVLSLTEAECSRLKGMPIPGGRYGQLSLMHEILLLQTESVKAYMRLEQFNQAENILKDVYKLRVLCQGEDARETKGVLEILNSCQELREKKKKSKSK